MSSSTSSLRVAQLVQKRMTSRPLGSASMKPNSTRFASSAACSGVTLTITWLVVEGLKSSYPRSASAARIRSAQVSPCAPRRS